MENLRENLRDDVLVRLRLQHADIVPLDDELVNLLQAEVPAASTVIVAPVLAGFPVFEIRRCCFSPWGVAFQRTTRHRCLKFLNLRPTRLFCPSVNAIA